MTQNTEKLDKNKTVIFNECCELFNTLFILFQALTDQQQFGKADEMYDKCIELEPDNATTYVHKGYVNVLDTYKNINATFIWELLLSDQWVSSLLQLQWKQDLDVGLDLINKAIEIDNKCDFAYETMGTIEVQR